MNRRLELLPLRFGPPKRWIELMLQRRSKTFTRIALGFLLAVLLASCSNPKDTVNYLSAPATVEHDPTSETAIVVMGIRTEDGNPNQGSLFGINSLLGLVWRKVDLETGQFIYDREFLNDRADFQSSRYSCGAHPACNRSDYTQIQYNLIKVTPGHYLMEKIHKQHQFITLMVPQEKSLIYENSPGALYKEGLVPGFEIRAGEIVYVGNYVLNALGEFPELLRIESNPEEARLDLPLYPNVSGEMVVRVPEFER